MEFKTERQLIDYLKANLYKDNFLETHTRPQLVIMLKMLYPNTNFKRGMCKERQWKHLDFWLRLHNEMV